MTTSTYHGERPIERGTVVEFAKALGYDPNTVTDVKVTAHHVVVTESDGRSSTVHTHPLAPWLDDNTPTDAPVGAQPAEVADVVENRGGVPW